MSAIALVARQPCSANDIEDAVSAAELDWLASLLNDARAAGIPHDGASMRRFETAWTRLERLAVSLGMPENSEESAADWAEDYLRRHGRTVEVIPALIIGTPEYRRRHIAMLWQAQLWHEAVMILAAAGLLSLMFYAAAQELQAWM
jgi:hypothetical protein